MKHHSLATLVIVVLAFTCLAQPDKDVVGTWKMDASRSMLLGFRGAPKNVVIRFELEGDLLRETLQVTNSSGETTRTVSYALDGREIANGSGDDRIKSKVVRNGDTVVLEWIDEGGTLIRKLNLSNDRRTMTINVHDSNPDGETDDLIMLDRQ
ncbi:MAG: hypothetical protein DMF73_07445 [Acidobacteria bacterium]|nr:MAG: hypothetical protein DMF73_07445 [Acidobacteriota bacterium]